MIIFFSEYKAVSVLVQRIKAFEEHLKKYPLFYKLKQIRENLWFPLSLHRLSKDTDFRNAWPDFSSDLNESTDETLSCAGLAAHQLITTNLLPLTSSQLSGIESMTKFSLSPIRVRIQEHSPVVNLRSLKQDNYGRLVTVRGTVIRVNSSEVDCSWIAYRCPQCNSEQTIRQTQRFKFIAPTSCKGNGCRARSNFQLIHSSPYTRTTPYQTIRLQESMQSDHRIGQIPKSIEVELTNDLVDSIGPGDDITLTGIIKVRLEDETGTQASAHKFYIQAITIISNQNNLNVRNSEFTERELEVIQQINHEPNPFNLLVHSLCPSIFGHEMVKAGLILALFGGCSGEKSSGNKPRTQSHVLMVGDPGIGKSHLLQACANVSPRGIFVCGNSTTNAGLTVSIRQERGSGNSLEAGALVLADQGVCCIDEFDKMTANYQSLLQVMEQQTVSIAKAGILVSLPARTCILAAANPSGGHYNKSKTVSENLKIGPTLLSRFDLVFILLDRADANLDNLLTAHIQALHANKSKNTNSLNRRDVQNTQASPLSIGQRGEGIPHESNASLYERLKLENRQNFNPIPHDVMQKYIGYARKICSPILTDEAKEELKRFYLELRKTNHGVESIPVTTRQLGALIRLTQARARIELSGQATLQHAQDVLAIFRYTMVDLLSTDDGTLQMHRSINGSGMSQATQARKYLQLLQQQRKTAFSFVELKDVAESGGFQHNITQIIDSLNIQGFLIKTGRDHYKFMT